MAFFATRIHPRPMPPVASSMATTSEGTRSKSPWRKNPLRDPREAAVVVAAEDIEVAAAVAVAVARIDETVEEGTEVDRIERTHRRKFFSSFFIVLWFGWICILLVFVRCSRIFPGMAYAGHNGIRAKKPSDSSDSDAATTVRFGDPTAEVKEAFPGSSCRPRRGRKDECMISSRAPTMPGASVGLKLGAAIRSPNPNDAPGNAAAPSPRIHSGGGRRSGGGFSSDARPSGAAHGGSVSRGLRNIGPVNSSSPPRAKTGKATTTQDLRKKQVLGYAAVAAVRRSLEQQSPSGKQPPGRSAPNKIRPRSEPGPRSNANPEGRLLYSARGYPPAPSVIACSLEPATSNSMEDGNLDSKESKKNPSLLVFSGGTAFNGVVEELKRLTTNVTHVLPVSDDGGSTSEILRVLGGPALGDIRSRCLRLSDESCSEALAVKRLLGYRLPVNSSDAKAEWYKIVEGEHELWNEVSEPYRETIRAFLVYFQSQLLMHSTKKFSFGNGSIGNFFFAGARIFIQSLDAAIFLYSRVSKIPVDSIVLPAISTNDRVTLGCELYDGTFVRGQNEISHPIKRNCVGEGGGDDCHVVDKGRDSTPPLPSPIKRIFYMSSDGANASHEVFPCVNPEVLKRISDVEAVVYGMGSLYTSICPLLVLRNVGESIAKQTCPKLLLLNGSHDRETAGMSASDFIVSICDTLNRKYGDPQFTLDNPPTAYINTLLVPENGSISVDREQLAALGINQVVVVDSIQDEKSGTIFDPKSLISCLETAMLKKNNSDGLDRRRLSPTRKPA
ncbi:uncharacterized protein LOC9637425 isoform X2 [Selaginella moellendorffii]|uniref:uncharacterized protein LOC9637425 isoform X2 n=1 Tax=Selaginella moellendorffii TaxID=88036 RepID=UPI000D1C73FA|nr:uncharacterized protein LOC9637425 isoform X2 [Selaginella moellendorffii]|eukprot:XP_024535177.1 uncharacterized protein LOC9637425 isoform X2 [Selaginella moellendorffii]